MSISYHGIVNPRTNMAYSRLLWDEPGKSGGSLKIETVTQSYAGEPERERKNNAIKEAIRIARAFAQSHDQPEND
jgi:hypothetical protein